MSKGNSKKVGVITHDGKPFEVPPGGTLGLLALGNIGVRAWKKAKAEWEKENKDGAEKK
jgi:hypothetical protein